MKKLASGLFKRKPEELACGMLWEQAKELLEQKRNARIRREVAEIFKEAQYLGTK